MDPAGVGALIGVSIMVCGVCSCSLYDRYKNRKPRRITFVELKAQRNPLLVKRHHSKVKKLFVQNG
jgi:hypothetical protein